MSDIPNYNIFDTAEIPCREISDPRALKEPLLSARMITYNHKPFIAKAIEGVLNQKTNFPFELVIGEDCSTDGTREIVFYYQKKHPDIIRIITSDKNVGSSKNSLRTERAGRGKYVAYCEGDDYWHHPLKLQKQVDFLESHPEVGLVHHDVHIFYWESGKRIMNYGRSHSLPHNDNCDLFAELLKGDYRIFTCSVCVRADLLNQVVESDPYVFQNERFPMGDWPRWLELSRMTKFKYFEESFATYTVHANSSTHTNDYSKMLDFVKAALDVTLYIARKYDVPNHVLEPYFDRKIPQILRLAYKSGDKATAKEMKRDYPEFIKGRTKLHYLGTLYHSVGFSFAAYAYLKRVLPFR